MGLDATTVIVIVSMALVTYLTRAGGLWLMSRTPASARIEAALRYLPGAILVSLVAPAALTRGPAETIAASATVFVATRTRNMLLAVTAGVALVRLLRQITT